MNTSSRVVLLLASLLLVSGCEPSCEELSEETPTIEVGIGTESFEPIMEGAVLEAAWGNQGGQHIWSSLRGSGVHRGSALGSDATSAESRPSVRFAVESGESVLALYQVEHQMLSRTIEGGEFVGATAFINFNPYSLPELFPEGFDPEENYDKDEFNEAFASAKELAHSMDWQFSITLKDSCGTEVSDSRTVRVSGVDSFY